MPKIQGTNRTVQTNTARLTPPSTAGFGASGRATQQLGKAVAQAGNAIASSFGAVQEKNDALDTNMKLLEFSMDQDQKQFEAGRSIDGDGRDHINNSLGRYDTESQNLLSQIPEKQRDKAQLSILRTRQRIQNEGQRQQGAHQDTYWTGRGVEHGNNVIKTMITPESLKKDGLNAGRGAISVIDKAIDQMPISAAKKQAMKINARKKAAEEFAQKVDPEQYKRMEAAKGSVQKVVGTSKAKGISAQGLSFIHGKEGLRTKAYIDAAGVPTIGYGHTKSVTMADVRKGKTISKQKALDLAKQDAVKFEGAVNRHIKVPLTQSQYDGLVSFAFNLGEGNLKKIAGDVNAGNFDKAAKRMLSFNKARDPRTGKLRRLGGLVTRRREEAQMLLNKKGSKINPVVSGDAFTDTLFNDKNRGIVDKRWKDGIKAQVQTSMKGKPSIELEGAIDKIHDLAEKNPNNEGIKLTLKEAETFKKEQDKGLTKDQLKYADDQGLIEVPSLIGQQDQVKAISERIQQGDKVADTYQIEPKYLRQEEKAFISKQFHGMEAQDKVEFLAGIDKGAGAKAKKFLSELSDIDPSLAHVGGLYLVGRKDAAMLAMQGMELIKDKSLKDITERLKGADVNTAYTNYFGNTFGPDSLKAAGPFLSTAKAIATTLMVQGKHENVSDALEEGMRRATGHTEVNGEQYGGVIEFNDQSLMVHPDHKASDYERLFDYLTTGEAAGIDPLSLGKTLLQAHGVMAPDAPEDGRQNFFLKKDGVNPTNPTTQRPVTAEELNDAQFVSVGAGRVIILVDGVPLLDTRKANNLGDGKNEFATGSEYILDLGKELEESLKLIE